MFNYIANYSLSVHSCDDSVDTQGSSQVNARDYLTPTLYIIYFLFYIIDIDVNIWFKHNHSCYHINLVDIRILNTVILPKDVIEIISKGIDISTHREAEVFN